MSANGTYKVFFLDDEDEYLLFQQAVKELNIAVEVRYSNNCGEMFKFLDQGHIPDLLFPDLNSPRSAAVNV